MDPLEVCVRPLAPSEIDSVGARLGLSRLGSAGGTYLVAWDGDTPVGHTRVTAHPPPHLQDVEVHPDARRRGVARALVVAASAFALERGASALRLTVSANNEGAHALYRSLGFAPSGIPPCRVTGTIGIRTGPISVDDVLLTWERPLAT